MYHNKTKLWDVKSKVYKDRTTVKDITRKIHNLRNQFINEMKKTAKKKSGQSIDDLYISKWPYFKSLLFLPVGLICRLPIGNIATYDVCGKYIATEVRNLSSEYLRKKLKRKFQQTILEISEEEERLNAVTGAYTNLGSVDSYSGHTADTDAHSNPRSVSLYSRHTNLSTNTIKDSQQPLLQSVAQYLHTETESSYLNR
ncbi:hypothetical protein RN001_004829 [Aquatica leii]|uniref:MADF domain-containing protein n=1 Tax=Aquatica leii TaxID=1421715 RepID=A0AAN7Q660_9COLE|nr:hypothetical protein RN001_004829 [Aquatica leii]